MKIKLLIYKRYNDLILLMFEFFNNNFLFVNNKSVVIKCTDHHFMRLFMIMQFQEKKVKNNQDNIPKQFNLSIIFKIQGNLTVVQKKIHRVI